MVHKTQGSLLPTLSVNRPVTVAMVLLCTLVLGAIAYTRISLQFLPEGLEDLYLNVNADYGAAANPFEVETQLTRPLEEMLRTVRGLERIRSGSDRSRCWIGLSFNQSVDMKQAYAQVRDRIERVRPLLPSTVRQISIFKFNENDIPILYFTFPVPNNLDDPYHFVETRIKRALERVDGVANVEFWGLREKQIFVDLNRQRLQSLNVDLYSMVDRLQRDNFSLSSGYLEDGGTKFLVRSTARFASLEEIRNLPLGKGGLRLGDVAGVSYRSWPTQWFMRTDLLPATGVVVYKESMANTVETGRKVMRVLKEEIPRQSGMGWLKASVFFDQGQHILEAVGNIQQTCLWGGLFAVLILLYFLRSYRLTLIITLAIPLSLLFTVIVMYFMGWSLNLMTMMGMMIAIGMVVDNSIVVVENIYRMRLEGVNNRKAAMDGASEVSLAITLSTFTTVVVFLPLILMNQDKNFRFFMLRIGLPVIVALLASLVVALFFIPLGTLKIAQKNGLRERRLLTWLNQRYQAALAWTLRNRLDASIILVIILVSMFFPRSRIKDKDWSENEQTEIRVQFDLPEYTSWERTHRVFADIEKFMTGRKARYGFENLSVRYGRTWGEVELFRPFENIQWYEIGYRKIRRMLGGPVGSTLSYLEVVRELTDSLPQFPDTKARVNWKDDPEKDPTMNLTLYGDDTPTLIELARELKHRLLGIPGIKQVDGDMETNNNEVHVHLNREIARQYGLDARRVASTVAYGGGGMQLAEFRSSDKEIQMYLQFSDADSSSLQKLRNTAIFDDRGRQVPLGTVASFSVEKGQVEIRRENGKTYLRLWVTTSKEDKNELFKQVEEALEGFELPQGYSWNQGQRFSRQDDEQAAMLFGIILAFTFVFLLMGIMFESFILPLSVMVAVPFAFTGVYWALYLTGTSFDIMCGIGIIILIGVVVNNAIVLVDAVEIYRSRGLERTAALIEAGKHRFRPILMTAGTTIAGLIPMSVGGARLIDLSYDPMGRAMIGGLLTSTVVTLVAVPLLYTFFDDLRGFGARLGGVFRSRGKKS